MGGLTEPMKFSRGLAYQLRLSVRELLVILDWLVKWLQFLWKTCTRATGLVGGSGEGLLSVTVRFI